MKRLFDRLFARADAAPPPLYLAVIAASRKPHWYAEGAVPDTTEGHVDMIATLLAFVLIRIEADPEGAVPSVRLTEAFIDDMDAQLREIGIGDIVVGKNMGKLMSMLGGKLGAFREGLADGTLPQALVRNLYRGDAPPTDALAHVVARIEALVRELDATPLDRLLAGELPA